MADFDPDQYIADKAAAIAPQAPSGFDPDQYLAQKDPTPGTSPVTAATTGAMNGATLNFAPALGALGKTAMDAITGVSGPLAGKDLDDLVDEYKSQRDQLKSEFAKAAAAHPSISTAANIAGGASTLGLAGPAAATTKGLAATGAISGLGATDINSAADIPAAVKNAAISGATMATVGTAAKAAAPIVGKVLAPVGNAVSKGMGAVSDWLSDSAGDLAVKATGATGKQAADFATGTGRELLDRGILKFGSTPATIAENSQAAIDAAEQTKSGIIDQLPDATVDRNTVLKYIQDKIEANAGNESQKGLVSQLQNKVADIQEQIPGTSTDIEAENSADAGPSSEVPISKAEEIRKGFDKSAKWDSNTDAPTRDANKIAANAYRTAGENAISDANPELGAQYKAAKTTQATLIPVQEAAAKRAGTLAQSPLGGLGDVAAAAVEGAPGVIGRRMIGPRIASMGAVSADQISNIVAKTPEVFGKFSEVLKTAAARGGSSLGATDYILQQSNPEYRQKRDEVFSPIQPAMADETEE
jgi:hypothetical protein